MPMHRDMTEQRDQLELELKHNEREVVRLVSEVRSSFDMCSVLVPWCAGGSKTGQFAQGLEHGMLTRRSSCTAGSSPLSSASALVAAQAASPVF